MMNLEQLLSICVDKDIKLTCQGANLKVGADKGIMTADIANALKHHKAVLIKTINAQSEMASWQLPITGVTVDAPLSYAQKRFWMLQSISPDSSAYHIPGSFVLMGQVDMSALEQAFNTVIARHDILRTCYKQKDQVVVQSVLLNAPFVLNTVDLSRETNSQIIQEAVEVHKRLVFTKPFDLGNEFPLRASILKCSDAHYEVLLCVHHIAADAWAIPLFLQELEASYAAICSKEATKSQPKHQYIDYAYWQQNRAQQGIFSKQREYWLKNLADIPHVHEINTDYTRGARSIGELGFVERRLSESVEAQLLALSRSHKTTLFTVFHTLLALLIHRWSGQENIVVGSPVSGRYIKDLEPMFGCFINTLAIKTEIYDDGTFNELLLQVHDTVLQAQEYQELSFDDLVEALEIDRNLTINPVFQIMLALQNAGKSQDKFHDLQLHGSDAIHSQAKVDLMLNIMPLGKGINVSWQFAKGLFKRETIVSIADTFEYLLEQILIHKNAKLSSYRLNKHVVNETGAAPLPSALLPELFFHQLQMSLSTPILIDENTQWSAVEIQDFIKSVQGWCRQAGLKRGARVFIALDKTVHTYACIYALWGMGITYIPCSNVMPQQRLKYMATQSNAKAIIFDSSIEQSLLPELTIQLDLQSISVSTPVSELELIMEPDDLAYIIFTSGTTGAPKGVCVSHQNLASLIDALADILPCDSMTMAIDSPLIFDASLASIGLLARGHSLVALPVSSRTETAQLISMLNQHDVDLMFLSTSYLDVLIDTAEFYQSSRVSFKFGGEACSQGLWDKLAHYCLEHDCFALNAYGPTETTVTISCANVKDSSTPNIGKPLLPNYFTVVDQNGHLCPDGMPGELIIHGPQVSQGYLHKSLTDNKNFVLSDEGVKGYCTGDTVVRRENGQYDYIGRGDGQVKVNGYRIELADIEATVSKSPAVRQVAVKLVKQNENVFIALFYVGELTEREVAVLCQQGLPNYMQPHVVQSQDLIALTPNGKIDKRRLELKQKELTKNRPLPKSGIISDIADIWQSHLPPTKLSLDSNFFSEGGHSLAAIKMIHELNHQLSANVPVSLVFEDASLSGFSEAVKSYILPATEDELLAKLEMLDDAQLAELME